MSIRIGKAAVRLLKRQEDHNKPEQRDRNLRSQIQLIKFVHGSPLPFSWRPQYSPRPANQQAHKSLCHADSRPDFFLRFSQNGISIQAVENLLDDRFRSAFAPGLAL